MRMMSGLVRLRKGDWLRPVDEALSAGWVFQGMELGTSTAHKIVLFQSSGASKIYSASRELNNS